MDWGLRNRLSRVLRPEDGRTVMLAADHGYFLGPTHRLEEPRETLRPLIPFADALMVTRGVVRACVDAAAQVPLVLRVSGGSTVAGADLADEVVVTAMEDAVRLNASAVALSVFVGSAYERQTLGNLARLVDRGIELGIPVLGVTAVGKELEKRDARYLALACRVTAELGAHDALQTAYRAMQEGASGVDMGRNVWQSTHPVAMIRSLRAIVHERASPQEACDLFDELRQTGQRQVV
ncbi:MAG: 3-hydroxy-5-phosphonooxypentane-2,4-dione thiolase LsrF [Gemmatimonadetes bacterium]|nr:3-hydroxy-5-phosphonooxypentane-2,4-dione thiolase LsrF [Gemmatimonadota bacterium]